MFLIALSGAIVLFAVVFIAVILILRAAGQEIRTTGVVPWYIIMPTTAAAAVLV